MFLYDLAQSEAGRTLYQQIVAESQRKPSASAKWRVFGSGRKGKIGQFAEQRHHLFTHPRSLPFVIGDMRYYVRSEPVLQTHARMREIPRKIQDAIRVTELLRRWQEGDADALNELMPLVYRELRRGAQAYLRNQVAGEAGVPSALTWINGFGDRNWRAIWRKSVLGRTERKEIAQKYVLAAYRPESKK